MRKRATTGSVGALIRVFATLGATLGLLVLTVSPGAFATTTPWGEIAAAGTIGAPMAPKGTRLSLSANASPTGTVAIAGKLTTNDGRPVVGAIVIAIDGRTLGSVTTGNDGAYGAQVPNVPDGQHTATAVFAGTSDAGGASANERFTVKRAAAPPAQTTAAAPPAPPPPAPQNSTTVITATAAPATATTGGYVEVSGTLLTAGNAPISQARIEVSSNWGGASGAGATSSTGTFSVSLGLPPTPEGQEPPGTISITVTYAGDGPYSGSTTTVKLPLAKPGPTPPPPTIHTETPAPPAEKPTAAPTVAANPNLITIDVGGAASRGVAVLVFVLAVGAVTALAGMGAVAWRRNQLLPGERRGFGTDFGK